MSLETSPETTSVDNNELTSLVSDHLMKEMQANFTNAEVTRVNADVSPISPQAEPLQQEGLAFFSDKPVSTQTEFVVSGKVFFSGSSMPTTEELDDVTQKSFTGDSGYEFLASLQNAEDAGLQSTSSISVSESGVSQEGGELFENFLGSRDGGSAVEDPLVGQPFKVLIVVFTVGFVLVAMYVFKTRRGRMIEQEDEMNANDENIGEESVAVPELPRYIQVGNENDSEQSEEHGSIRDVISVEHKSSQISPEGVPSGANVIDSGSMSQYDSQRNAGTQLESTPTAQGQNSDAYYNVGASDQSRKSRSSSQKSMISLQKSRTLPKRSMSMVSSQKSLSVSDNVSVFVDLPSISEASDRNQEHVGDWNPCGGYAEQHSNNYEQDVEWGKKPASNANSSNDDRSSYTEDQGNDYGFCVGMDHTRRSATRSRSGGRWGQKPYDDFSDSQSYQTSRISNTSK